MPNKRLATSPVASSDEVTVLVFKDNNTARSFQVPLSWITRFGFILGMLATAAVLGSFFAVKYYRVARKTDPSHVIDLEQKLSDLRSANKTLETKLAASGTAAAPAAEGANPLPAPTVTVTVTPTAESTGQPIVAPADPGARNMTLFGALPAKSQDLSAQASKLPITVSPAKTSWSGSKLKVVFNIQYVGTDRGSQQGRIIVLARGPNAVMTYPDGVMNRAGAESLINPQGGEYFSVSRFREVRAEFQDSRGGRSLRDVEILMVSLEGNLLFYQKIEATAAPAAKPPQKAAPSQTPPATPAATAPAAEAAPTEGLPAGGSSPVDTSSELIEPGVDQ